MGYAFFDEHYPNKVISGGYEMSRIKQVKVYVNSIYDQIDDVENRRNAYKHSYEVAQCCALLAAKRGLDEEIATIVGLLHDIYSYKTGHIPLHGINGAEMVRVAFKYELANLFTENEQTIIKSAIFHHSDRQHVHEEYDELIKDCLTMGGENKEAGQIQTPSYFNRHLLGDIAEKLAQKKIVGELSNSDFRQIIKYFPETFSYKELSHAWCAAFVYHSCIAAGLVLPIRILHTAREISGYRLACVKAWYEWGLENRFCSNEKAEFEPERGDIVIYNNIIPTENKPKNSIWCDHMGIVLACDNNNLTVAEGNIDNQNQSGVILRKRDVTIGCYLRIPNGYEYDSWNIDFKTGEKRRAFSGE